MSEGVYSKNPDGSWTYAYEDGAREIYSAAGEMTAYIDAAGRVLYQKTTAATAGTVSPWIFLALAAAMIFFFKEK